MRATLLLIAILCPLLVFGQDENKSLFQTVRTDATIVVQKHRLGPDEFEITVLDKAYDAAVLAQQCNDFAKRLGSSARGLSVGRVTIDESKGISFVKAKFTVDGFIDMQNGKVRIQELLRAFSTGPEGSRIRGYSLVLQNLKPASSMVRLYNGEGVRAQAEEIATGVGIEYRILVESSKTDEVIFPDRVEEQKQAAKPSDTGSGSSVMGWIALAVAGVAAGVLVYLALLRGGRPKPTTKTGR
jgi:hypothetical protein